MKTTPMKKFSLPFATLAEPNATLPADFWEMNSVAVPALSGTVVAVKSQLLPSTQSERSWRRNNPV